MAQKVLIEILDDIDGSEATQTVPFALDGVSYEIDLSDENAEALRGELDRYIDAARRVGGRKVKVAAGQSVTQAPRGSGSSSSADRERNREIREWALANGYDISGRGRISNEIYAAFESGEPAVVEAEAEPEPVAKPARKRAPRKKKTDE